MFWVTTDDAARRTPGHAGRGPGRTCPEKKCSGLVGLFPTANPDGHLWSLRHSLARFGKLPEKTKFWQSKEDRALISFRNVQTSIF